MLHVYQHNLNKTIEVYKDVSLSVFFFSYSLSLLCRSQGYRDAKGLRVCKSSNAASKHVLWDYYAYTNCIFASDLWSLPPCVDELFARHTFLPKNILVIYLLLEFTFWLFRVTHSKGEFRRNQKLRIDIYSLLATSRLAACGTCKLNTISTCVLFVFSLLLLLLLVSS